MSTLDYCRILGVSPNCTLEEVRRRYRVLARRHHPDLNPDDPEAAARFRLIVAAFEAIQAEQAQAKARGRSRRNAANYRRPRFSDTGEVFEEFFGIGQEGSPLSWSAGADFRYDLEIPFVAAIKGTGTVIPVEHHPACPPCRGTGLAVGAAYQECPDCQGRGRRFGGPGLLRFGPVCERCRGRGKVVAVPCRHCDGSGLRCHHQEYHLRIPPGTRDGARFRIMGEGGEGFQNGPRGNLLVVVHVALHDFFTRVGNDIHCKVEVSFAEAARGGVIRIPTLDGCQWVNLPQGAQTGWSCRFLGAGAPGTVTQPPGDQVNQIIVTTTQTLGLQPRSLPRELDRLEGIQLDRAGHE
jgi:molecular chaperone DnaJ